MKTPKIIIQIGNGIVSWIGASEHVEIAIVDFDDSQAYREFICEVHEPDTLIDDLKDHLKPEVYNELSEMGFDINDNI